MELLKFYWNVSGGRGCTNIVKLYGLFPTLTTFKDDKFTNFKVLFSVALMDFLYWSESI